ncbi:WecB/TagA/CpsF family glycosyltransferase [Mesorhizobium marinum]|uniref:WecB/TagA/CpsF family glycosyltransferase n=1 Tax=Mesorhizobium marinum TaxID=3228790 RepID=A0ABV3R4S1_9HYPH
MTDWPTSFLGRLPIAQTDIESSAKGFVAHALTKRGNAGRPFYSTSANGQVLALCGSDAGFLALMRKADQIHADGMPMVLYSRMFSKRPLAERVATTDLVHAVASRAAEAGISFYFLGASEDVNARAVEVMQARYPGLVFAGRRNGYFGRDEEAGIVDAINAARPDILWIGLGVPLEQEFVDRNLEKLTGVGVIKTSGGLFDFISGKNKRAPAWMQKAGLEWVYRAWLEPRRLAVRYLTTNPKAIGALIRHSA